jgi:hypothetical protein
MFDIGLMLMKLLAILGGAAFGGLVTRMLVGGITRRMPRPALNLVSLLGAVAAGLAVWLWLFGAGGGGGFGSGGGWWPFGGRGGSGGPGTGSSIGTTHRGPPDSAPLFEERSAQVHMLGGGRVQDGRFYVLHRDSPRTLAELQEAIRKRRQANPNLSEVEIVIYKDSVADDTAAVRELIQWLEQAGLKPKISLPGTKAP